MERNCSARFANEEKTETGEKELIVENRFAFNFRERIYRESWLYIYTTIGRPLSLFLSFAMCRFNEIFHRKINLEQRCSKRICII